MVAGDSSKIELRVSDQVQLRLLAGWLAGAAPVKVDRIAGRPLPGEQGAGDVLTILASSSVLATALKILPEFIRSRRSSFRIEVKIKDDEEDVSITLEASNAEEGLLEVLARLNGE